MVFDRKKYQRELMAKRRESNKKSNTESNETHEMLDSLTEVGVETTVVVKPAQEGVSKSKGFESPSASKVSTALPAPAELDRFGVEIRPRICTKCPGLTFKDLISHSDHLATHNLSPAQWANAYEIMSRFKKVKE